jgi:hypothetical protein
MWAPRNVNKNEVMLSTHQHAKQYYGFISIDTAAELSDNDTNREIPQCLSDQGNL